MAVQPSEAEIYAIKQQLKLLGHTLPTDVIVKFLQVNSGLLSAYQQPGFPRQNSGGYTNECAPAEAIRREHPAESEPGLIISRVTRPVAQAIPKLDVTWASSVSSQHLKCIRPAQVPSNAKCLCALG